MKVVEVIPGTVITAPEMTDTLPPQQQPKAEMMPGTTRYCGGEFTVRFTGEAGCRVVYPAVGILPSASAAELQQIASAAIAQRNMTYSLIKV